MPGVPLRSSNKRFSSGTLGGSTNTFLRTKLLLTLAERESFTSAPFTRTTLYSSVDSRVRPLKLPPQNIIFERCWSCGVRKTRATCSASDCDYSSAVLLFGFRVLGAVTGSTYSDAEVEGSIRLCCSFARCSSPWMVGAVVWGSLGGEDYARWAFWVALQRLLLFWRNVARKVEGFEFLVQFLQMRSA